MSTTATIAPPDVRMIPTLKIVSVSGTNPRGIFSHDDPDFLQLKDAIAERGLETPIKVGPAEVKSGDELLHPVIWGHRRFAACLELGLGEIPAIVDDKLDERGRFLAALSENLDRADMTPLAEARALRHLRGLGVKQADAAKAMRMSERGARDREKLLDVPVDVAELIGAGEIPLEAIPHFALIARASESAPMAIVDLIREGKAKHGLRLDLLGKLSYVADALSQVARRNGLQPIQSQYEEGTKPGGLPISEEQRKEIAQMHRELPDPPPGIRFEEADRKLAKEKGCLLELAYMPSWGGSKKNDAYITDGDLVFELAKKKIPAMRKKIEAELAQAREKDEGIQPLPPLPEKAAQADADRQKQAEREQRKRQKEEAQLAKANAELRAALDAMGKPRTNDLDVLRLVCAMALGHHDTILDLVDEGLGKLDPQRYYGTRETEDGHRERWADDILIGELATAETGGDMLRVVLRTALAAQHRLGEQRYHGRESVPGPRLTESQRDLDVGAMLDDLGESLGLLPAMAKKAVAERRKSREEDAKQLAQIEAREAAQRAAEEAEQQQAEQIFAMIEKFPGIPAADVAKKTQLKPADVTRHLKALEADCRIEKKGHKYSVAEKRQTRADRAVELIAATPGIDAATIAKEMGIKPNYLYRILGDLEKEGRISKDGRKYTAVEAKSE